MSKDKVKTLNDYALTVEDVLNHRIDELEMENHELRCKLVSATTEIGAINETMLRQGRSIAGYHKAVEKAHDALKDVYHGE